MRVRWYLLNRQSNLFGASGLGQDEAVTKVNGKSSTKIGESKGRLTIAAVRRADQVE